MACVAADNKKAWPRGCRPSGAALPWDRRPSGEAGGVQSLNCGFVRDGTGWHTGRFWEPPEPLGILRFSRAAMPCVRGLLYSVSL